MAFLMRVLALLALLAASPAVAAELRLGAALPDFALPDSVGHPMGPDQLRAPIVIVEFWATWCAPCRSALPALAHLATSHGPRVQLLAINIDHDRTAADRFLETYLPDGGATVLFDPDNRLMAQWGAPGMPTIVVAVHGRVRVIEAGYSTEKLQAIEAFVRQALEELATPTP